MLIGYARLSTADRDPTLQVNALRGVGCKHIFIDEGVSGGAKKRPQLDLALAMLKPGDVLAVWRLDRIGRSLSHLIDLALELGQRGIGFRSLSEAIDTTTNQGELLLHMFAVLAKFERSLIAERTRAGLTAAQQRGEKLGRKPKLTPDQIEHARRLIDAGESPSQVAKIIGVSPATLYRAIPAGASNRNSPDLFSGFIP